jgi:uncharacterized membrane protein
MRERWMLVANLAAAAFMAGVIWFVQLVHYPLMAGWPHDDFPRWEAMHRSRTAAVVMPAMLVEGATAAWLLLRRPAGVPRWMPWAGLAMLVVIWGSTFLVQVPCHDALSHGWDAAVHARLVSSNWLRTALWTGRVAVLAAAVVVASRGTADGGR